MKSIKKRKMFTLSDEDMDKIEQLKEHYQDEPFINSDSRSSVVRFCILSAYKAITKK